MADNANPQAVKFSNEKARVFADVLLSAIETAREFDADYAAQAGDTLFPNSADLMADGSDVDGRPRVRSDAVRALRTIAQGLVAFGVTGSPTNETRLRTIAVNGVSRF